MNAAIAPLGLDAGDRSHRIRTGQPVQRRERGAIRRRPERLRITKRMSPVHRATTVNGVVGSRPSCSRTATTSLARSSIAGSGVVGTGPWQVVSAALVLRGALGVDLPLFALAHELLQHRLELGVRTAALPLRWRILQGLDRQVDLAVFLDRLHLG